MWPTLAILAGLVILGTTAASLLMWALVAGAERAYREGRR